MIRKVKRLISAVLAVSMLLSMTVMTAFASDGNVVDITMRDDPIGKTSDGSNVYALDFYFQIPTDISSFQMIFSVDKETVTPATYFNGSYSKYTETNISANSQNANMFAMNSGMAMDPNLQLMATQAASWKVHDSRLAVLYGISVNGHMPASTGGVLFSFYFTVKDNNLENLNAASLRIETDKSEGSILHDFLGNDVDYANKYGLQIYDQPESSETESSDIHYEPGADSTLDLDFTYTNSDKDQLIATEIVEDNLTLEVPTSGTNELQLSVTNTGLNGTYAGSDAETTWEITVENNTGATIDRDTGVLKIGNTGRAGTVTVQATTTAGSVTKIDTAEVTITRADSEPGTVTISGETEITVPATVTSTPVTSQYEVSVTDQFGAEVAPAEGGITWSIEGTAPTDVSINKDTGVLTVSSYAAVPAEITIKATVTDVNEPALLAAQSDTMEVSLVREESVATTVEIGGDLSADVPTVAEGGSETIEPTATVYDQYGETMTGVPVTWSLSGNHAGISINSETGVITVTTAVESSCNLTITATVDGTSVTKSADVKIDRAESVATEIIILREEVLLDGADTVVKPVGSESKTYEYFALVMDQYDMPMRDLFPTMTASTPIGVSFAGDTLTVTSEAAKGTEVTITASYDSLSPVSVTVTITDVDVDWSAVDAAIADQSLTYGQKNSDLANLPATGTASAAETGLEGTFTYKDGDTVQDAGPQKVTVVFTVTTDGEYKGVQVEKTYDVTVSKKAITVTADDKTKTYGAPKPELTFTVPDGALVNGDTESDLTVDLTCNATETTDVGTVEITGTGSAGNYEITVVPGTLTISPATVTITTDAPKKTILASDTRNTVEGLKALLDLPKTVDISGAGTAATTETITWADATEPFDAKGGTYTYVGTVEENANFDNQPTLTATVTVTPVHVTAISGGESITASKSQVTSAADLTALGVDAQVTLTYDNNVAEQSVSAVWDKSLADVRAVADTVTDTSGDKSVTLTLTGANIPAWATVQANMPQVTITITNKYVIPESDITFNDITTTYGTAYTPSASVTGDKYGDVTDTYTYNGSETLPTDAGTYTITVTVENDSYKGTKSAQLTIEKKALSQTMITIDPKTYTYTGHEIIPTYTVSDVVDGVDLISESDYIVEFYDNINVGSTENNAGMKIKPTPDGNYAGEAGRAFTILPKNLADADIAISGLPESVTYTGEAIEPLCTVTFGDITLGTDDYDVTYSNNTDAGTATVKISGQGNYTGEKTATFTIDPAAAADTVTISGTGTGENGAYAVGDTLTAEVSGDKHGALAYQWYVNGAAVADATGDTFEIPADATSVYVVATSSGNYVGTLTSSAIEVGKKPLPTTITISITVPTDPEPGTAVTATVKTGEIEVTLTIEWLRDGQVFRSGAADDPTFLTYTLTEADKGHTITARLVPGEGYTGEIVADQDVSVDATEPGKPVVTATADNGSATIRWTVDDGGSPIIQYVVAADGKTILVDGDASGCRIDGLTNGTKYTITVIAINAVGESEAATVTATPQAPTPVDPDDDDDDDDHHTGGSSSSVTRYTIRVEQNRGGEITPDTVRVRRGQDQTFRIRADEGYEIEDVLVDGESVGDVSRYTFENVRKAHTIEAIFRAVDEEEPGQTEQPDRPFTDVNPNGWSAEYIYYLYDRGVVNGVGDNLFAPTRSITRAEFVKMLAGVAGVTESGLSNNSGFADVEPGSWYAPYVTWAVQSGVTTGTSATTFSPEANITREQMAVMIYRFAQSSGVALPGGASASFTDAASFSGWATEAIYAMQRAGIIDGVGDGRFAPQDNATREQACKMLAVLMELM